LSWNVCNSFPIRIFNTVFKHDMKRIAKRRVSLRKLLMDYYAALYAKFGHRNWWPADSPFEVCVGAILTQNTAWKNVAKAISSLKQASALDPFVIYRMPVEELPQLIRPAGYYNVKAVRLRNFISLIVEKHGGDLSSLFSVPLESLREELLSINGIGKETADSIILYAAGKPIFVVDAYTKRVLERHKIIAEKADYDSIQRLFHAQLPRDVALFNDFHAQIVAVGHNYCKKQPLCEICPLREFLPGPVFGPF
jgi:endonuclease III related protein